MRMDLEILHIVVYEVCIWIWKSCTLSFVKYAQYGSGNLAHRNV